MPLDPFVAVWVLGQKDDVAPPVSVAPPVLCRN
jgi:hypothetical protein